MNYVYKIRDKKTGLFSSGGTIPSWSNKGKVWKSLAHARSHITMVNSFKNYAAYPYATAEILEIPIDISKANIIEI